MQLKSDCIGKGTNREISLDLLIESVRSAGIDIDWPTSINYCLSIKLETIIDETLKHQIADFPSESASTFSKTVIQ